MTSDERLLLFFESRGDVIVDGNRVYWRDYVVGVEGGDGDVRVCLDGYPLFLVYLSRYVCLFFDILLKLFPNRINRLTFRLFSYDIFLLLLNLRL